MRSVVRSIVGDCQTVLSNQRLCTVLSVFVLYWLLVDAYTQLLPLYLQSQGLSVRNYGYVTAGVSVLTVILAPIAGVLSDRWNRLRIAMVSIGGLAGAFLGFALFDSLAVLVGLMGVVGTARLFSSTTLTPAVNDELDEAATGIGWGIRDVAIYLGAAIGLGGAGIVLAWAGSFQRVFLLCAGLALGGVVSIWWRERRHGSANDTRTVIEELTGDLRRNSIVEDLRSISGWSLLGKLLLVTVLAEFGMGVSMFLLPLFATENAIDGSRYLVVYSSAHLFAIAFSLLGGVLADRIRPKWLCVGNYAIEGSMLLVFGLTRNEVLFLVGLSLWVLQTTFEPGLTTYLFGLFPDTEGGRVWSVIGGGARLTGIVAPAAGGVLYEYEPRSVFLLGAICLCASTLLALTLPSEIQY